MATNNIIIPTFEVLARVVSNPSIEVFAKNDSFFSWGQIISPVVSAFLAASVTYILTNYFYSKKDKEKLEKDEASIRTALKYEIFHDCYELMSMESTAEKAKKVFTGKEKARAKDLGKIIYSEPLFVSFDSMISNNLLSAIKKEEQSVFSIYSSLRESNLVYKRLLGDIDDLIRSVPGGFELMPYQKDVVLSRLDWLIECARTLRESFEGKNGYVNDISFLDRVEWDRFKERCSFNSGET